MQHPNCVVVAQLFKHQLPSRPVSSLPEHPISRLRNKKTRMGAGSKIRFGRRDWIRTNDPHHVKVVL